MSEHDVNAEQLAQRLREVREYLNYSQQYVSEQTGLPRSAISDLERGTRRVSTLELKRLAALYSFAPRTSLRRGPSAPRRARNRPCAGQRAHPEDQQEVQRFITLLHKPTGAQVNWQEAHEETCSLRRETHDELGLDATQRIDVFSP